MTAKITRVISVDLVAGNGNCASGPGPAAGFAAHKRATEHVRVRTGLFPY
jgi:hypothetical protein